MFLKIACVLLLAWLAGVVGLYRAGDLVHVLLLAGILLLLLGFLRAREAALRQSPPGAALPEQRRGSHH